MKSLEDIIKVSARTAISRKTASKPTRLLEAKGLLRGLIIDYGCGKGADVEYLKEKGYKVVGFDPNYRPTYSLLVPNTYDTVLCNYVLNVVPPKIRHEILKKIHLILKCGGKAFITVRDISEGKIGGTPYEDGVITSRGTFQKLFTPKELVGLVSQYFDDVMIISRRQPLTVVGVKRC